MNDLRKAAQQALEALDWIKQYALAPRDICLPGEIESAVDAVRAALAQPIISPEIKGDKTKPVAYQWLGTSVIRKRVPKSAEADAWTPLYAHPPQRKPLTDEQIAEICMNCWRVTPSDIYFARAIEKAHGIGGRND